MIMDSLFIDKRFVRENEYYFSVFARVWRSEGRKIQKKKKENFHIKLQINIILQ